MEDWDPIELDGNRKPERDENWGSRTRADGSQEKRNLIIKL
jgi:hypothetical protein